MAETTQKLIANNKKAYHDYFIDEKYEAGISLVGTEVKSLRMGKCSIKESFVEISAGEAFIVGNLFNRDPLRKRRLLLHKNEIRKMGEQSKQQGYTLVPLQVYLKRGRVKVEVGLAKGKKQYDKRATIAKKDAQRSAEREYKVRFR